MIGIVDLARAETDLTAGELTCPGCGGTLRPWGHARARRVRDRASTTLALRPRRTRCTACGATHVLLLGAVIPRRADTTAVIGTALLASARGSGYRRIAAELGRPEATVRRWVRSVRDAHTEWLRAQALVWIDAQRGRPRPPVVTRLHHGDDRFPVPVQLAVPGRDHQLWSIATDDWTCIGQPGRIYGAQGFDGVSQYTDQ